MKNSIVWTFARANPPTIGHKLLFDTVMEKAAETGSDHLIVLSQTQNYPDNPLSWEDKVSAVEEIYDGDVSVNHNKELKTPYQVLEFLCSQYEEIHMVVGEDRKEEFKYKMSKYANAWGGQQFYIHSAGLRDGSTMLSSISASAARSAIYSNDHQTFVNMIPLELSNTTITKIFYNVKQQNNEWFS
jgi:nicotinic acid mononucleotide adenylyltransferase